MESIVYRNNGTQLKVGGAEPGPEAQESFTAHNMKLIIISVGINTTVLLLFSFMPVAMALTLSMPWGYGI